MFQHAAGYERPVWPPEGGWLLPMMHFDFHVADLDAGVAEAAALGATLAEHQQQEHVRVLSHPQAVRGCAERALGASRA